MDLSWKGAILDGAQLERCYVGRINPRLVVNVKSFRSAQEPVETLADAIIESCKHLVTPLCDQM